MVYIYIINYEFWIMSYELWVMSYSRYDIFQKTGERYSPFISLPPIFYLESRQKAEKSIDIWMINNGLDWLYRSVEKWASDR